MTSNELIKLSTTMPSLLAPVTTMAQPKYHTIYDGELDLLTSTQATVTGSLCSAALGVSLSTAYMAWPMINRMGDESAVLATVDIVYFCIWLASLIVCLLCGTFCGLHHFKRSRKVAEIRERPSYPMQAGTG